MSVQVSLFFKPSIPFFSSSCAVGGGSGSAGDNVHILRLVDRLVPESATRNSPTCFAMSRKLWASLSCDMKTPNGSAGVEAYLVRQSQAQLDLVGGDVGVATLLDCAESARTDLEGAPGDAERVHGGGCVGVRGQWTLLRRRSLRRGCSKMLRLRALPAVGV